MIIFKPMKTFNFQIITKDFSCRESKPYLGLISEVSLKSGADVLQLRNKTATSSEIYSYAVLIKNFFDEARENGLKAPFLIINDRPDIAFIAKADGVHLGQEDFPARETKKLFPGLLIGVSVENKSQALAAEKDGADYIGLGPVFRTDSKRDAGEAISRDFASEICRSVNIPVIAIGGIGNSDIPSLAESGFSGAAVISAVSSSANPAESAGKFRNDINSCMMSCKN